MQQSRALRSDGAGPLAGDAGTPWLDASGLTKVYGGVVALADASLRVCPGEIRGLVGANGAGKSTLVKLLTGAVAPTAGDVRVDGLPLRLGLPKASLAAGIVAVPQELTVAPTMTVAENIMMGHYPQWGPGFLREREMRRATEAVFEILSVGIQPDAIVGELPLIRQRLVMIARAFSFRARLMIFDEPTATISPREVGLILDAIRVLSEQNVSILYVSHQLDEIDEVCTAVTVLRDGRVVADLSAEEATHSALVNHLSAGREAESPAGAGRTAPREIGQELVLELSGVSGEWLRDVSLTVGTGEIVALAGLAGSGAREVLLTICGALPFSRGSIGVLGTSVRSGRAPAAVRAGVGFLPGDRSLAAFPSHSVRFNVSLPALLRHAVGPFVNTRSERRAVAEVIQRVALRHDQESGLSSLSGGNQQKALVARWLGAKAKLLLLDDPTAGVDVATRPEIHARIRAACADGTGVLLVSTDIDELVELADRVVVMERGAVSDELGGLDVTSARVLSAMTGQQGTVAASPRAGADHRGTSQ